MEPFEIAQRHLRSRSILTDAAVADALRWWYRINPDRLDLDWAAIAPAIVETVAQAQVEAAAQATPYLDLVRGSDRADALEVAAPSFGGISQDGRELGPALFGAVTKTKEVIAVGRPAREAFQVGAAFLATVAGAAIQDMGRQADFVAAIGARRTHYIRVLSPGACARCAVLAGKGSAQVPFKRHPRCKCQAWPIPSARSNIPIGFMTGPDDYFETLSVAEQDRIFTNAGAEAIRHGADVAQVVNARRGSYGIAYNARLTVPSNPGRLKPVTLGKKPDGSPLQVFATTEGTTARGQFGRREIALSGDAAKDGRYRRTTTLRLMPEQIAIMADGDPPRWIELLRRYGYLY